VAPSSKIGPPALRRSRSELALELRSSFLLIFVFILIIGSLAYRPIHSPAQPQPVRLGSDCRVVLPQPHSFDPATPERKQKEVRTLANEPESLTPSEDLAARLAQATSVSVFCDFDGTYSIQDVGSTLATKYLGERRKDLWRRYEQGEFLPWEYNLELFTGFRLPTDVLHEFLATIDLDPGASALQAWCGEHDVAFRILSDGFDYNLEWLQEHNDIRFDFVSNHLVYGGKSGEEWRISPGRPNPSCGCGTGTCKSGIIAARRKERPGSFCVHVGNGRVSDLCGAVEADLAFAKQTLADALREQKQPYEPFDTRRTDRRGAVPARLAPP
jgi:2,3-diketo-5-methylthio-1-phosphopentane phosphatase